LPRLKTDLVDLMQASIDGRLASIEAVWDPRACVSVVLAAGGYPGTYEKGKPVTGLEYFDGKKDSFVFHAGTALNCGQILTSGGRVMNVVGMGNTIVSAIDTAYKACEHVSFEGMHYRRDIGSKAVNRVMSC
jgi:phosphoribosylamine--glycine ligase